jgi:pimeloyl-ACP methyl ester carboxylesterase
MTGMQKPVAVRMLGPLAIDAAGRTLGPRNLGGIKPRQLLEILLLARGRTVPKARYVRLAASPFPARQLAEANARADVRNLLPDVRVPTLVMMRPADAWLDVENGRYLGARPGARLVELPGVDHDPWAGDVQPVLAAVRGVLRAAAQVATSAQNT